MSLFFWKLLFVENENELFTYVKKIFIVNVNLTDQNDQVVGVCNISSEVVEGKSGLSYIEPFVENFYLWKALC